MVKTWNVVLEGKEEGTHDDWTITFVDAAEYVGGLTLNKRYTEDLIDQIKRNSHYEAIKNVKSVKSSTGEDLSKSAVGLILATAAKDDLRFGFLFGELKSGGFDIIGLWPEDFAKACKENPDIHKAIIVRMVQEPGFFSNVSMVLP